MKHARSIMAGMQASKPSVESADYEAIVSNESFDESYLGAEAANLINENEELYSEASELDNRSDRMDTLVEYVDSQVNTQEGGATQNEVALVEQAVDAALDGTGEDVEVVLPSLESAVGSTISLEGIKETIERFLSVTKELVATAAKNVGKFFKGMLSRISALKNRIEKVEGQLSGDIQERVEARVLLSYHAMEIDGKLVKNIGEMTTATTNFTQFMGNVVNRYCPDVIKLNEEFANLFIELFKDGQGRGEEKKAVRDSLEPKYLENVNKLIALNGKLSDGKGYIGDFSFIKTENEKATDFRTSGKVARASIPKESDESDLNQDGELSGINKASVQKHLSALKNALGLLHKLKTTDIMNNIEFFSKKFKFGPFDPLVEKAILGTSTTSFVNVVNSINRVYMESYTRTPMKIIDHFFRVADAQLSILEKAVK